MKKLAFVHCVPLTSVLIACSLAGGCATDEIADPAISSKGQTLMILGDGAGMGPVTARIAGDFDVLETRDFAPGDKVSITRAEARDLVANVQGVAADLGQASDADMDVWSAILGAALDLGVPIILENVHDADRLASVLGVGFSADLIMVTRKGDRHSLMVRGDSSIVEEQAMEGEEIAGHEVHLAMDMDETAGEVSARLFAHEPGTVTPKSNTTFIAYDIDFSTYTWNIYSSGQNATLNLDFALELIADELYNRKYLIVTESGGGLHPGSLLNNGSHNRGWFQEYVTVWVTPSTTSVDIHAHAPATDNNSSTYSSSTGWTAGVSGSEYFTLSYSSQSVVSTTLSAFSTVNDTSGANTQWTWKMSTTGNGNSYNSWGDLVYHNAFSDCKLYSLPSLATSNITPAFEVIYKAAGNYTGTTSFELKYKQGVRKTSADGFWSCSSSTTSGGLTRSTNFSVNFGLVSTI